MEVIFEAANDFNEFFSCYVDDTVIVISTAEYIEDDMADIPTLTPVCYFEAITTSLTPIFVKAEGTVG